MLRCLAGLVGRRGGRSGVVALGNRRATLVTAAATDASWQCSARVARLVRCTGVRCLSSSSGSPPPLPKATLLSSLPAFHPERCPSTAHLMEQIRAINRSAKGRKLVVVDDDPTGTQSVKGFPVLAEWSVQALARELADSSSPGFFLLSNVRALPPDKAASRLGEISANLDEALKSLGLDRSSVSVVSRSDSTLRGHFPLDVQRLAPQQQQPPPIVVLAPFFDAGGRITVNDVHYAEGPSGWLLPCHLTPFAKDAAFGYQASDLRQWLHDKTAGAIGDDMVISLSLHDIRRLGVSALEARVAGAKPGSVVVVNAVEGRDLTAVALACYRAEAHRGTHIIYRSAADLVAARAGLEPLPPLTADFFAQDQQAAQGHGGLVVVGSYVPKSSEQLGRLLQDGGVRPIELHVDRVVVVGEQQGQEREQEIVRVGEEAERWLKEGRDVVVFTSRNLKQDDGAGGLVSGQQISDALVEVVRRLSVRPRFLVAKGGITSNDTAVAGLGVKRAMVEGPLLPGVPVWSCGPETKFPGLKYVVFPGNVGDGRALLDALHKLRGQQQPPDPPATQPTAAGLATVGAPPLRSSRTLDILTAARARGRAVGAFNVYNLEGVLAVARAAQHTGTPALLQVHPSSLSFGGAALLELCLAVSRRSQVPIAVHLDHAHDEKDIRLALEVGVDSVMVDGSMLAYEDNVAFTAAMAHLASQQGVAVEAELGKLSGEEDGLSVPERDAKMTDPAQVADFLRRTGVSLLAVTIGNVHGKYARQPPLLDWDRLEDIKQQAAQHSLGPAGGDVCLVLHGASGLPAGMVQRAMRAGVCKFNVNTEVREALLHALTNRLTAAGGQGKVEVLQLMGEGRAAMEQVIAEKMRLFDGA